MMVASGHRQGWPVARGGSQQSPTRWWPPSSRSAGRWSPGSGCRPSRSWFPRRRAAGHPPRDAACIVGDQLPRRVARAYRRYRQAPPPSRSTSRSTATSPGATTPAAGPAPCISGGDLDRDPATEAEIHRGRMPDQPFVLVGQQYLADPTRSAGNLNPIWAYAHVLTAIQVSDRGRGEADRAVRSGFPGADRGDLTPDDEGLPSLQRQLRRRGHHRRRQQPSPAPVPAPGRAWTTTGPDIGCVPVFGGDASGRRRPWNVWVQCSSVRAAIPAALLTESQARLTREIRPMKQLRHWIRGASPTRCARWHAPTPEETS